MGNTDGNYSMLTCLEPPRKLPSKEPQLQLATTHSSLDDKTHYGTANRTIKTLIWITQKTES
jgi:hypothetical protein